jgi:predicted nucleotidyltransferase
MEMQKGQMPNAEQILHALALGAATLSHEVKSAAIVICGSLARGDFVPTWSDVDLVALVDASDEDAIRSWTGITFEPWPNLEVGVRYLSRDTLIMSDGTGSVAPEVIAHVSQDPPFGLAKIVEALRTVGVDSILLCGTLPTIRLTVDDERTLWNAGIRDTVARLSSLRHKDMNTAHGTASDRQLIGQVINLCRVIIRAEGYEHVLSHQRVKEAVQSINTVPFTTKQFVSDAVYLREQIISAAASCKEIARQLGAQAPEVHDRTIREWRGTSLLTQDLRLT